MTRRAHYCLLSRTCCIAVLALLAPAAGAQWAQALDRHADSLVTVTALLATSEPQVWRRHVGTGVVVAPGRVITSSYVVAEADSLHVETRHGRRYGASIVGGDGLSRLVLLQTSDDVGPSLDLASARDPSLGEQIAIIGTAYGFPGKLSPGIVSGLDRTLMDEGLPAMIAAFEVSADAEPGMSGAPVFGEDGALVGVVLVSTLPEPGTTHAPLDGGGLVAYNLLLPESLPEERRSGPPVVVASPLVLCADAATLRYVSEQLLAVGEVPWGRVGLSVGPTPSDLADYFGLGGAPGTLVVSVAEGGPAEASGLEPGDVILSIDGEALESGARLMRRVLTHPGQAIALEYLRDGTRASATMLLGTATVPLPQPPRGDTPAAWLGVSVGPVSQALAGQLGLAGGALTVASVGVDSPAHAAGLRVGDVIRGLEGGDATVERLRDLMAAGAPFELTVLRAGQAERITLTPRAAPPGFSSRGADALGLADL